MYRTYREGMGIDVDWDGGSSESSISNIQIRPTRMLFGLNFCDSDTPSFAKPIQCLEVSDIDNVLHARRCNILEVCDSVNVISHNRQ